MCRQWTAIRQGVKYGHGHIVFKCMVTTDLGKIKKIDIKFDPFGENVAETRSVWTYLNFKKIKATSPNMPVTTTLVNDRTPPTIDVHLADGKTLHFKAENMTSAQIMQYIQYYAPKDIPLDDARS